jgi:hypothetical protein
MPVERQRIIQLPLPTEAANSSQAETQAAHSQKSAARPSRMPDFKIAFAQQAYAAGADKALLEPCDERLRLFMAHAVTKPELTLKGTCTLRWSWNC